MRPHPPAVVARLSAVHKGTAFERRARQLLQDGLSMRLARVGGKADGGVDLAGWWWLPSGSASTDDDAPAATPAAADAAAHRRLRVLAQCKAETRKIGPSCVREMEGVWLAAVPAPAPEGTTAAGAQGPSARACVALLVSESPFTHAALLRAHASTVPFLLLHLPPSTTPSSPPPPAIGTAYPNPALARLTAPLEIRWEHAPGDGDGAGRPGLWLHGRRVAGGIGVPPGQ